MTVDNHEVDFLVRTLMTFVVDTQDFRLVTFLGADAKQSQRLLPGALNLIIMILRQHDAFALVEHRRLMVFIVESRLPIHHDKSMIFARMRV